MTDRSSGNDGPAKAGASGQTGGEGAAERSELLPVHAAFRVTELPARKPRRFKIEPGPEERARIALLVGASSLRKLSFGGEIRPAGRRDFVLEGQLAATVVQPCVATLAPVVTRIEEGVLRRYLAEMPEPEGEEVEMPEDDTIEPLPEVIDAAEVMVEALALAMPLYPRAPDVAPVDTVVTEPGAEPLSDDRVRPFAGLAALRDALAAPADGEAEADGEKTDGAEDGEGSGDTPAPRKPRRN